MIPAEKLESLDVDTDLDAWVAANLTPDEVRWAATQWLGTQIRKTGRAQTLTVERAAVRASQPKLREFVTPKRDAAQMSAALTDVRAAVARHTKRLISDWTAEMLAARISMPDGTTTTWGAATVEQHRTRAEMFEANATWNLEGAARHRMALAELAATGAATLNDVGVLQDAC